MVLPVYYLYISEKINLLSLYIVQPKDTLSIFKNSFLNE